MCSAWLIELPLQVADRDVHLGEVDSQSYLLRSQDEVRGLVCRLLVSQLRDLAHRIVGTILKYVQCMLVVP